MSRRITICPIGHVEEHIIELIAKRIQSWCQVPCETLNTVEMPYYAHDKNRSQYNASLILKRIGHHRASAFKLLGVTSIDLFVPILKYVYGLAQIEGQCAVISLHRLLPQFYDELPDADLLASRIEKTALHEFAHTLGMIHCRDRRCAMYSSTRIADTDFKNSFFCPTCRALFEWHLNRSLEQAAS